MELQLLRITLEQSFCSVSIVSTECIVSGSAGLVDHRPHPQHRRNDLEFTGMGQRNASWQV